MKRVKIYILLLSLFSFLYIVCEVYRNSTHESDIFYSAFPFLFGLLYYKLIPNNIFVGPGTLMLNIVLVVRYIIFPFLFANEGFVYPYNCDLHYVQTAQFFMLSEMLVIMVVLRYYCVKKVVETNQISRMKMSKIFVGICILIYIYILIFHPEVFRNTHFILNTSFINDEKVVLEETYISVVEKWLEVILLVSMLSFFYRGKNKYFIVVFAVIMIPRLFYIGNSRLSLLSPAIVSLFLLLRLYPIKKKFILIFVSSFLFLSMFILTLEKSFKSDNIAEVNSTELANLINAYFSGVSNVAIGIEAYEQYGDFFDVNYIINDMFRNFPVLSQYFSSEENSVSFYNKTFYNSSLADSDQIPPTVCQSIWYFGYLFFGILPFVMVRFVLYADKKFFQSSSIDDIWIYALLGTSVGWAVPGSFQHLYMVIYYSILPLLVLFYINKIFLKIKI